VIERATAHDGAIGVAYQRLGLVLASTGSAVDIEGVLNPAVARDRDGKLLLYPRMVAAGNVSRIGLARAVETQARTTFEAAEVLLRPEADYERRAVPGGMGCEDPRVTFIPRLDAYVMAYTAFGPHGPRIALAISPDAYAWKRLGLVQFADEALNHVPNKDAAFFPEPVLSPAGVLSFALYHRPMLRESFNGQAPISLILSLPPDDREVTCIAYAPVADVLRDVDELRTVRESVRVLPVGDTWGLLKNGAGTPPVKTSAGWLSFFHGVDALEHAGGASLYYRAGIVIHDLERPDRVVYRSPEPLLDPQTPDERVGIVNDVVFPTGIDVRGEGRYDVYYGAADARIACARVDVSFGATIR
jgi:beta-1,2-mannobiose phosphorylase / 1,2-beta-oligomannan phosphorylase